jgi:hypothetical protein
MLLASAVSIAGAFFERLLLTAAAWLILIAALVLGRAKRKQLVRERDEWIGKLRAENERLTARSADIATGLRELNVEATARASNMVRRLYKDGMARPDLYRYRLNLQVALHSGTEGPEDPRRSKGMSLAWRMRAWWRKVRGSKYDLPEDPITLGALERYEADEATTRPEPPASS